MTQGRRGKRRTLEEKFGEAGTNVKANRRPPANPAAPGGVSEAALPPVSLETPTGAAEVATNSLPQTSPQADVTVVLYSSGRNPVMFLQQVRALDAQTLQAKSLWVHIDGPGEHDSVTLNKVISHQTSTRMGLFFRLALARKAPTKYVLLLDEDAIPGPRWLEAAMASFQTADPELPFGAAVIASGGVLLDDEDDPLSSTRESGPGAPRSVSMVVDYGFGGWLFDRRLARLVHALPEHDSDSRMAFGMAMATAAQAAQIRTVSLAYTADRSLWGLAVPTTPISEQELEGGEQALSGYRNNQGWELPLTGRPFALAERENESQGPLPGLPGLPGAAPMDAKSAAAASLNTQALSTVAPAPVAAPVAAPAGPAAAAAAVPASASGLPGESIVVERVGSEALPDDGVAVTVVVTESAEGKVAIPPNAQVGDELPGGRIVTGVGNGPDGVTQVESKVPGSEDPNATNTGSAPG